MAKRRLLKKDISYLAGDLFSEVLVCKLLIPGVDVEKADQLMTRILDLQDSFIRRAHQPSGKDNKKLVKEYYKKLVSDLQTQYDALVDDIAALSKDK